MKSPDVDGDFRNTMQIADRIIDEISRVIGDIREDDVEEMIAGILTAGRIFVNGAGRSGFIASAFAMRLVHLGLTAYVVGETVTPRTRPGDLMVACSGTGETPITLYYAKTAKKSGVRLVALTADAVSELAGLADEVVVIPGTTRKKCEAGVESFQYGGSLFEQSLLMLLDTVCERIRRRLGRSAREMDEIHTDME